MDECFNFKMMKNMDRPAKYGQGIMSDFMKMYIDHMADEGLLQEFMGDFQEYASKKLKTADIPHLMTISVCSHCRGTGKTEVGIAAIPEICMFCRGTGKKH